MGHLGRDQRRIAVIFVGCWLLLLVACMSTGPVQWILCGTAVLGMVGVLVVPIIRPHNPQQLQVTVTDYRCERELVRLAGVFAVQGSEEVYRPELKFELLDSRKRVVGAKSFWPTGQTKRHVQPGYSGTFMVSLPVGGDPGQLAPRLSCSEYPCTVTWAAAGGTQPATPLTDGPLPADSGAIKGD